MNPHHLTELVRLLEQRGHLFPTDPAAITAQLRQTDGNLTDKLHRRAILIDRDHALADRLHSQRRRLHALFYAALGLWAVLGFLATYGLMQQSAVNFFVLLLGVLGMNTIMLLIWFIQISLRRQAVMLPEWSWHKDDAVQQSLFALYREPHFQPYVNWRKNVWVHQLALSGLGGMFAAALLLLLVRQYHFTWESTLLSHETFTQVVAILSWLPEKLGFDVPNQAAILASRNQLDTQHAAAWGGLLLGSLLCYGVVPRLLAWALSAWRVKQHLPQLNLQLPYYQNITQKWQRRIVDSDADYRPDTVRAAPSVALQNHGGHWAAALDVAPHKPDWYQGVLGQDWLNKGVIASRDDWADLNAQLSGQTVQLLLAVRATQTPDRGIIRRLAHLSAPIILCLWTDENSPSPPEQLAQWHEIAEQYAWTWVQDFD